MTEMNRSAELSVTAEKPSVLSEAQQCLFRPGVQLRMTAAILLCLFAALLPLMLPLGAVLLFVPAVIFVLCPMLFGLAYMGEKAKNREVLTMKDLFVAFSKRYLYAIGTVLIWVLLMLLPLLLVVLCAVGAYAVFLLAKAIPETSSYAFFILLFGGVVTVLSFIPALRLLRPAYFFLAIRVKDQRVRVSCACRLSMRLLARGTPQYTALLLKYAGLSVLSFLSVCTLFPIYTIPLMLIATPVHLDRLAEGENPSTENNLSQ